MINNITFTPKSVLFQPYRFIGYLKRNKLKGFNGGYERYSDRLLLGRKNLTKLTNYLVIYGAPNVADSNFKLNEKELLKSFNEASNGTRLKFITESLNSRSLSIFEKSTNGKWRFVKNAYEDIKRF